ncbi:MAG: class I SAM-dependent methyltransferase [Oscillospiraceae bacterium]
MNEKTNKLEKMSDFFAARVKDYDAHMLKNVDGAAFYYQEIAKIFPKRENLSVVDLGCGTGLELEEIFKVNATVNITGLDLSDAMLRTLHEKYKDKCSQINTVNIDYFHYNFGIERFDGAISVQTLHHFPKVDKLALYRKIYNGIRKNGFYIEADYYAPDQQYEEFYFSENQRLRKENRVKEGEFYHYDTPCTISNQTQMFFKAGFQSVHLCYMHGNTGVFLLKK